MKNFNYISISFNTLLSNAGINSVYIKYLQYLPLFLLFLLLSLLITPWIGYLANKWKILDLPAHMRKKTKYFNKFDKPDRHIHKEPRALLGGLIIPINLLVLFILITNFNSNILAIFIGVLIITIFSFFDDKVNLPPRYQFLGQFLALTVVAISTINLSVINNPLTHNVINLSWFSLQTNSKFFPLFITFPGDFIFIALGMVIINALKWVGGSDGLIESNSIIIFLIILIISIRHQQLLSILIATTLLATLFGFLPYALPPAFIESGSIGKTLYGFLITVLAILNGSKLATSIIVLALPLTDFLLVIIYRYRAYKPKNLLELMRINEAVHFHHILLKLGYTQKQLLLIEVSITLIAGIIAISTFGATKLLALFITFLLVFLLILLLSKKANARQISKKESPEKKYSY